MNKRMRRHVLAFCKVVAHAGVVDADACVASFERRLASMFASDLYQAHNVYPTMDVEHVYVVIAMCVELRERGLCDEKILDAVNAGFAARWRFFSVLLALIDRLPCAWAIVRAWNVSDHKKRVADGSIDYNRFEVSEHSVEYDISGCRYVDMFQAWGVRPLCKVFCETDTRSYARLTRHVEFVRHSDLSDGNSCHDQIFECGH
jgi:hypothetical protein